MLVRMHVRMQTRTASLENNKEVPQKVVNRAPYDPYPKGTNVVT